QTPSLQAWAKRPDAAPRAQSLTPILTDRTAQRCESSPEDGASIREWLENADAAGRAFFNGLSCEQQLWFLDQPEKIQKKWRGFIEESDPPVRPWFLKLSVEDQLVFLNDPDQHRKILGRAL